MTAQFEWDESKAASNFVKHGISFTTAIQIFDDPIRLSLPTWRSQDGEGRVKTTGLIENRLFTVVWVERSGRIRLISARPANDPEAKRYGNRDLYS